MALVVKMNHWMLIVLMTPSHLGCDPLDICAVAREHSQSEGSCISTSLNVGNIISGETSRNQERGSSDACAVACEHPQIESGCNSTSLNVGNDIVGETPRHKSETPLMHVQ